MQYIPDLVANVVDAVSTAVSQQHGFDVYYHFGHHQEVMRILTEKDGDPSRPGKYPLIWLVTPFTERNDRPDKYASADLHFVIANDTQAGYSMEERRDNVFIPILYPVMQHLLNQFTKNKSFQVNPLVYEKMDLQYARVDSTGKNLFNDYVDVIDLKIQKVLINKIC